MVADAALFSTAQGQNLFDYAATAKAMDDGRIKILAGQTTADEVLRVTQLDID